MYVTCVSMYFPIKSFKNVHMYMFIIAQLL